MTTTKVGTIEMWYDAANTKMESFIKENGKMIISIPCPQWADKTMVAAVVERESCRKAR